MKHKAIVEAFSELAPRYEQVVDGELRRFWGWRYSDFVDWLVESISARPGDCILDVATGTGLIPRRIHQAVGQPLQMVGLDITLAMLKQGRRIQDPAQQSRPVGLVCASAMDMPFRSASFDRVVCGLGTHHMEVWDLLSEMRRVLKPGGTLTIADVGAASSWNFPGVKSILKIATFLYFLATERMARAWAEAGAVSHVHTAGEWLALLARVGFLKYQITKLPTSHIWAPAPLIIQATCEG